MTPSPDLAILRHLAARTHASAAEIGTACRMTAAEVRARLHLLVPSALELRHACGR